MITPLTCLKLIQINIWPHSIPSRLLKIKYERVDTTLIRAGNFYLHEFDKLSAPLVPTLSVNLSSTSRFSVTSHIS